MVFDNNSITKAMLRELHDPSLGHLGLFGYNGRLIKRSIIIDNNVFFEEKLRFLEDKSFCWNVLSFCQSARYLHKQLYSYCVYPNVNTAVTESLSHGFSLKSIKLIVYHVTNSLKRRNLSDNEIATFQKKISEMGYKFQFITLAGFHTQNIAIFELAEKYKAEGMTAYSKIQEREFAREKDGYTSVKHQREVGTSYFDAVSNTISSGKSSTTAMEGSTESEQF